MTWAAAVALMLGVVGCGSDLNQVFFETLSAAGRTYVDQLLTDVANTLADREDDAGGAPSDGDQGGDDADDGDGDGNGDGGPPAPGFDELTGDPAAGEALYTANTCAVCHCADGAGGCLPGAPPVTGVSAEVLDEILRGDAPHASKVDLTNQEIVDLEAYLASL
jgi:cytochrome c553